VYIRVRGTAFAETAHTLRPSFQRLDVNQFAISKSQRKLVHKFNRYVLDSPHMEDVKGKNKKQKNPQKSVPDSLINLMAKPEHSHNMDTDNASQHEFEVSKKL
jgi:hypothetical protein